MGDKLRPHFTGPYNIHESLGKGVYRLSDMPGKVIKSNVNA